MKLSLVCTILLYQMMQDNIKALITGNNEANHNCCYVTTHPVFFVVSEHLVHVHAKVNSCSDTYDFILNMSGKTFFHTRVNCPVTLHHRESSAYPHPWPDRFLSSRQWQSTATVFNVRASCTLKNDTQETLKNSIEDTKKINFRTR